MGKSDHPIQSMSTYLGGFPPSVPRGIIERWAPPRSTVLDPFCGSGTTLVEARLSGRPSYGLDLNPLAVAIARAKIQVVQLEDVIYRINVLAREFGPDEGHRDVPDDIRIIFHDYTLAQLSFLKSALGDKEPEDIFLRGALLGVMHGKFRRNGRTAYLSIDMPNTFSMSPGYVRNFVEKKGLIKPRVDVFSTLRERARRLLRYGPLPNQPRSAVFAGDAASVSSILPRHGVASVGTVVTSPPYLGILRYGAFNWIRLWFLGHDQYSVDRSLDGTDSLDVYLSFIGSFLKDLSKVQKPGAIAALVIGDVEEHGHRILLAERVFEELESVVPYEKVEVEVDDYVSETKTTRIWGEKRRGRATALDRVLVLTRTSSRARTRFGTSRTRSRVR